MDYTLVICEGALDLPKRVKELMKKGYTVQGGVSVVYFPGDDQEQPTTCFYQAMVKYEEP